LGTWYLAVFQIKLGTKLFIFTLKKKKLFYYFLLSFGHRVHFRGQKLIFGKKKFHPKNRRPPPSQKFKNFNPLFISLKVAHSAQEVPKKISGRWLIKKLKTIEVGPNGIGCAAALLNFNIF
jgi:hypothetical protein